MKKELQVQNGQNGINSQNGINGQNGINLKKELKVQNDNANRFIINQEYVQSLDNSDGFKPYNEETEKAKNFEKVPKSCQGGKKCQKPYNQETNITEQDTPTVLDQFFVRSKKFILALFSEKSKQTRGLEVMFVK